MKLLTFIETSYFSKKIKSLISDDSYSLLQLELLANPEKGDLIPHGGGIRKIRWRTQNTGKSGGIRVIYYYTDEQGHIYMLLAYGKSEKDDLSQDELKILRTLVKQELK